MYQFLLGIYSKELKKTGTQIIHIHARSWQLSRTASKSEWPKSQTMETMNEQMNKMVCAHNGVSLSHKIHEALTHAQCGWTLKNHYAKLKSQAKRSHNSMIPFIWKTQTWQTHSNKNAEWWWPGAWKRLLGARTLSLGWGERSSQTEVAVSNTVSQNKRTRRHFKAVSYAMCLSQQRARQWLPDTVSSCLACEQLSGILHHRPAQTYSLWLVSTNEQPSHQPNN